MKQVAWYPYYFHCILIGAFISIIGPFGGFFASGFKRAFKIKDFGDVIPGHGGILDRFDCQIFVGWFVFFYYNSFIKWVVLLLNYQVCSLEVVCLRRSRHPYQYRLGMFKW